jgi:HAD superfamily hydrolase (TIGR01509 family)
MLLTPDRRSDPTAAMVQMPKFLYFDLGMVMVTFSLEQMCRQMADVADVESTQVRKALFEQPLQLEYEKGHITTRQFYEEFCRLTGTRPDYDALLHAASDIFELNLPMLPLITQLQRAGYRLGVLSNTCEIHWLHCYRRFRFLRDCFQQYALSYQLHTLKPDAEIYQGAAQLAGVAPAEMFFVDDLAKHVTGAKAAGVDAVQYASAEALAIALRGRGLRFNY